MSGERGRTAPPRASSDDDARRVGKERRKLKLRMYGRRPEWLPRAVWLHGRRWRRLALLHAGVIIALCVGLFLSTSLGLNNPCFVLLIVFVSCVGGGFLERCYKRWWISSFYRRLQRLEFRVCLDCGYDLHGLPDAHVCPECSRPYEISELTATWRNWIIDALDLCLIDPK